MQDISQLKDHIVALYERHRGVQEGTVATYIPEFRKTNPEHFGLPAFECMNFGSNFIRAM